MILREVTIGRAPDSDILYGAECMHVSNNHAIIYSDGSHLILKDISTNGTLVNNVRIHHQSKMINVGDVILLAGRYPLSWSKIGIFFPIEKMQAQINERPSKGKIGTILNPDAPLLKEKTNLMNIELEISKFNWGAFFLYPIWGFANGMWWTFLIGLFLSWVFLIPNIVFGVMGSKWAWENKKWRDINHFIDVQNSWKKWGIGLFLVQLFLYAVFWIVLVASAM